MSAHEQGTAAAFPYLQAQRDHHAALAALAAEQQRHESEMLRLEALRSDARVRLAIAADGIDLERVQLALSVMYAEGWSNGGAERSGALEAAVLDIAHGPTTLRTEFFGTKNYDRWSGQRCDCWYGCGPKHGTIVFRIGLKSEARARDWSDAEREACVYYLNNLARIEAAAKTSESR